MSTLKASAKISVRNTSLLTLHSDVQAIAQPFFNKFSLAHVNMIRVDNEGCATYLCDNYHWLKNYLENRYPEIGACENNAELGGDGFFLWSSFSDDDPVVLDSRRYFNLQYGLTMVQKNIDGTVDYFNYGVTNSNPSEKERLTRMIPEFEKFQQMFYDKGKKLIAEASQHAYQLQPLESFSDVVHKPLKRFHLGPAFAYEYLTDKELQCLHWLVKGKSLPEIAKILARSERTAEKHIENVKKKLNCRTQCEIGYIIGKVGIDQYW